MKNIRIIVMASALLSINCMGFAQSAAPAQPAKPTAPSAAPAPAAASAADPTKPEKPIYDEQADAKKQIAAALAKAKKENRRVLIQWGGNWCGWCTKLHNLYKSNKEIGTKLLYEYDLVFVDAGKPAGKNIDLAESYGADLKKHGFPYLTVLDANGKPLANQETGSLENKDQKANPGHDPKMVLEFLTKNQAPYSDAQKVLDAGLADASQSGKRVFLHFGAPWCHWCRKLEAWMDQDEVRSILAKEFVDLKIDTARMIGGEDILTKYRASNQGGIPWFVVLDSQGKPLIDSNGPKGNIGFPSEPAELEHFEKMLRQGAQHITDAEIKSLIALLKAQPKA